MRFSLFGFLGCSLGAAAASLACSSGKQDAGPSPAQTFTDQFCTLFQPCCSGPSLGTDGGACQAWVAQQAQGNTYDGDAGAACLAAMQQNQAGSAACADDLGGNGAAACFHVFPSAYGDVPPGGACLRDTDCQAAPGGTASCYAAIDFSQDSGAGGSSTRACVQTSPGQTGDGPCLQQAIGSEVLSSWPDGQPVPDQTVTCNVSDGLYCDFLSHTCQGFAAVGATCDLVSAGYQLACGPTATCVPTTMTSGQCVALTMGTSCVGGFSDCGAEAHCSSTTFVCIASLPEGAACTNDDQCDDACVGGHCATAAQATLCGTGQ
jgi:hypothetical protein